MLGVFLGTMILLGVSGWVGDSGRTAESDVLIVGVERQIGADPYGAVPRGWYIDYQFVVDGRWYAGKVFRAWGQSSIDNAKVCFDPADPANHLLVLGSSPCR